jgi:hypothetical protein
MASFTASVDVAIPVDVLWDRITDWPSHGRWIPLTRVRVLSDRPDGVGARFVTRTGIGPVGFDDPMEVVAWRPPEGARPGICRVRKFGRVVLGGAEFEVSAVPGGSRLAWTEDVEIAPARLTRPAGPLIAVVARFALSRVLRVMARRLEEEVRTDG